MASEVLPVPAGTFVNILSVRQGSALILGRAIISNWSDNRVNLQRVRLIMTMCLKISENPSSGCTT